MSAVTIEYTYGTITKGNLLTALKNYFTGTLNWTEIEDSISSDDFFVVQPQFSNLAADDRMVLEVKFFNSTNDYIAFTLWRTWSAGSPGSGTDSVYVTDHNQTPTTGRDQRYHRVDLSNGGTFWIESDDGSGAVGAVMGGTYLVITSKYGAGAGTINSTKHIFTVCSIRKAGNPNFGVLSWFTGSTPRYLGHTTSSAASGCVWCPPVNHDGTASNAIAPDNADEVSSYLCQAPCVCWPATTTPNTGRVPGITGFEGPDTYNQANPLWPLYIFNQSHCRPANTSEVAGLAVGFRGYAMGVWGAGTGVTNFRSVVTDPVDSKKYTVVTENHNGTATDRSPCYAFPNGS